MKRIKKRDCIHDFIEAWRNIDGDRDRPEEDWNSRFKDAGYYSVIWGSTVYYPNNHWDELFRWCSDTFGVRHFVWCGSKFWFDCEENAILFALRWS
jgi:hypothetical protein